MHAYLPYPTDDTSSRYHYARNVCCMKVLEKLYKYVRTIERLEKEKDERSNSQKEADSETKGPKRKR